MVVLWENILIFRKYTLRYLRVNDHSVYNFHSNDSGKNLHTHTENDKTSGKMLTIGESGVQAMQASFVLFVFFRI